MSLGANRALALHAVPARIAGFFKVLGPGLITGAADDDPSGISTYSVAGASTGYSMLWLTLVSTPMMAVIQGMCARIAMVSGVGLAAAIRRALPAWLCFPIVALVVAANTLNVGADIAGMAASMQLLAGGNALLWVVAFGIVLAALQVFCNYHTFVRIVKYLAISLLAYVVTAFIVHPDWMAVLRHAFVPEIRFDRQWLSTLMGVLGTTITPYLFFWQSALMVEEERAAGRKTVRERKGATDAEIRAAHADVNTGMLYSNIVMFFIILTTAVTLNAHGKTHIATAADAANALRPLAGNFAYLLFTAGMVGTGLLAVPALAGSSAYVAAETFRFRGSLDDPPSRAPRFYAVIVIGILVGILLDVLHVDPIAALFWSAVINGVVAVPLIAVIIWLANRKSLMGRWRSSRAANVWGVLTFASMSVAAVLMFAFWNQ